jgi:hypothetical protein
MKKKFEIQALRINAIQMLSTRKPGNNKFQDFNFEQAIEEINIYHIELEMQVEELQQNRAALEKNKAYLNYLFAYAPGVALGFYLTPFQG